MIDIQNSKADITKEFKGEKTRQNNWQDKSAAPYRVRIPGYLIEASIDFPRYHPHRIWHLAYISQILKGYSVSQIKKNPPWPIPREPIITNEILKELIEQKWLIPDWCGDSFSVSSKIKKIYDEGGEVALAKEFLKYDTLKGRWWVDAIAGTLMSTQQALYYDVDYGKKQKRKVHILESKISKEELLDTLNLDIISLIRFLGDSEKRENGYISGAFVSSPIEIVGQKDIEFDMYGESSERILPGDLNALELMLWENDASVFGKKKAGNKKLFKWNRSTAERFATTLEKFPNYYYLASNPYYDHLCNYLLEQLDKKEEWIQWYRTGMEIDPIAGEADLLFNALSEIIRGNAVEDSMKSGHSRPSKILLTTSFLNVNNLRDNAGLIKCLMETGPEASILIVYGHANDDVPEKQSRDMKKYLEKIHQLCPQLNGKIKIISSKRRSHEKVVLSSNGDWMIGSWNPGSSRPGSRQFEAAVRGKNAQFAFSVLTSIKEIIEDKDEIDFVLNLEDRYRSLIQNSSKSSKINEKLYLKLRGAAEYFVDSLDSLRTTASENSIENQQDKYEKALCYLRLCLMPFLKKGHVSLVNEYQSRDVLITQTRTIKQNIFLASDRVSESALDRTLLGDIQGSSEEGRKTIRILWGREWEEDRNLPKDVRDQLKEAKKAINKASTVLRSQMKTKLKPMENHSKFALFDGCRGLITSENILNYGGEKSSYESRELGIFIESLPAVRYIEGKAIMHRLGTFHPDRTVSELTYRPYEWIIEVSGLFYAFEEIKRELDFDYSTLRYIEAALIDSLENPELENMDSFDKMSYHEKKRCYEERKVLVNDPFAEYLWKEGMRSYLLWPTRSGRWMPVSEPANMKKILNLKIPHKAVGPKSKGNFNIDAVKSNNSNNNNNACSRETHPIVEEIMEHMKLIPNGCFMMGSEQVKNESPVHEVAITQDFYVDQFPVTQKMWNSVMGNLPVLKKVEQSPNFPIININYNQIQEFLSRLNKLPGSGGFDLLTEAQWEYACRAGSRDDYCFGNNPDKLEEYAWTKRNSNRKLHDVGQKKPNKWGLYDMHGLVYEMVKDGHRNYSTDKVIDPVGPLNTKSVVARGGHWGRFPIRRNKPEEEHFRCSCRPLHPKEESSYRASFRLMRKLT